MAAESAVQLTERSPRARGLLSVAQDDTSVPLHTNSTSPPSASLCVSKGRKNSASADSAGDDAQQKSKNKSRRLGSRRLHSKKQDDLLTVIAVPRGYLDYWNERLDEQVGEIEDTEEFENAYKKQEQRLFPFRTSSTEWTINGALGIMVFVMAWGPLVMAIGFLLGGLAGFGFSLANDMCRLRRRESAAKKQRRRIDQLMRWANYHFATSQSQLQLVFKVIMEYQVLARLGCTSKTARSQLKLLFNFLSASTPKGMLFSMARSEISMCFLVCQVCTQCVNSLRKRPPPVVARMSTLMADEGIQNLFKSAKAAQPWRKRPATEKEENVILCADVSREVQRHVMKGGDLVQALRLEPPATVGFVASDTSQESQSKVQTSEEEFGGDDEKPTVFEGAEVAEITAVDLRPNTDFNVVLPGPGIEGTIGRRSSTLKQAPPAQIKSFRSVRSGLVDGGLVGPAAQSQGAPRLFKSYEDLVNFDTKLKHQTPIGSYEFQFLEEKKGHDPSDPMWELTVDQAAIKVYKYNSPDSPVVLVKAYATLEGIPVNILCHHIRHIPTRLKWDTTFGDYRVVEQDVDGCEMIYCLMKAPFPVSNRDFLQWRRTEEDSEANVTRMLLRSADHPSVPEKSGVVRAETLISGYIMEGMATDSKSSTLFILAQTDVKGLIPKWLVNTTAARAPVGWVDSLKKACKAYMKQHGEWVPPYNPVG